MKPSLRQTLPALSVALAAASLAGAASAQVARFEVTGFAQGLSGNGDDDHQLNQGQAPLRLDVQVFDGTDWIVDNELRGSLDTSSTAYALADAKTMRAAANSGSSAFVRAGAGSFGSGTINTETWSRVRLPFRIDAPGLAGQSGTMQARLSITGFVLPYGLGSVVSDAGTSGYAQSIFMTSGVVTNPPASSCQSNFNACYHLQNVGGVLSSSGQSIARDYLIAFPFRFGDWTSFDLQLGMRVGASASALSNSISVGDDVSQYGMSVDHTLNWGGIQLVLNGAGAVVSGWSVQSLAGVNLATPVPEPGAWALWLAGLAATGSLVRRRAAQR
jgi:hypothetical protein